MEMRRRIQETALDLFDREGFENVSVEEIAQAAGCSVGNIYHYFKSKDELAIQLTQHVDEAYQVLEQAYLADTDRSGREKLLDFVGRSLEISVGDEVLYKAFIHGLRYPEQGVLKGSEKRVYYRLLGELVGLCRREGSIRQELTTAEVVEELVTLHRGCSSSGASMRAASRWPSGAAAWRSICWRGCGDEGPDHPQASAVGRRSAV